LQLTGVPQGSDACSVNIIRTSNNLPQSFTNPGGPPSGAAIVPSQVFAIVASPFNAASIVTDGFDLEASYQFDMQEYDVPGTFVLRSLINHTSKYILTQSSGRSAQPGAGGQRVGRQQWLDL
jgi:hypothetical protein